MAFVEKAVVLLMIIMVAAQVSNAAEYKVGDSAGWTNIGNIDYKKWAADKNFKVGDTIIFEYDVQFQNVMRVTHADYRSCNTSSPITTLTTGKDTIELNRTGHQWFVGGVPGHCQQGQKVDINVIKEDKRKVPASAPAPTLSPSAPAPTISPSVPTPTISPSVSDSPSTSVTDTPSPSPSPSNASPMNGAFGFVGLAMTVFSIFYF